MKRLSILEVHHRSVKALGLDSSQADLKSTETIACSLRRSGGFLCPCPFNTLIHSVVQTLEGLLDSLENLDEEIKSVLESLLAYGDFLEFANTSQGGTGTNTLIYLAPPSFIRRNKNRVLLIGIVPDHISPLPDELEAKIEYVNHIRRLSADDIDDLGTYLTELGLIELNEDIWLRAPNYEPASNYLSRLDRILDLAPHSGDIADLLLLDPTTSVRYYSRRWVKLSSQSGRFVARRNQLYGSPIWCYVEAEKGSAKKFIDLPLRQSKWRGCDEAWRLQAAIDALRGKPQLFRVRPGTKGSNIMDLFSPVPSWAQRKWDAVGERVPGTNGSLFSYGFHGQEIEQEIICARNKLWLEQIKSK